MNKVMSEHSYRPKGKHRSELCGFWLASAGLVGFDLVENFYEESSIDKQGPQQVHNSL